MHAHGDHLLFTDLAFDQRHMSEAVNGVAERHQTEIAIPGIQFIIGHLFNGFLIQGAILDQVGNGADLEIVLLGEHFQIFPTGHGAIFIHDFTDHPGRFTAGQLGQIAGRLGVTRAAQYTARL